MSHPAERRLTVLRVIAWTLFAAGVILFASVTSAHATGGGHGHTPVTLCHNGHTITVDDDAVPGHLDHHDGDTLGECPPGEQPTEEPTDEPTDPPTDEPTDTPTDEPTDEPTETPTPEPTDPGTDGPTDPAPTENPADVPTVTPPAPERPTAAPVVSEVLTPATTTARTTLASTGPADGVWWLVGLVLVVLGVTLVAIRRTRPRA